MAGLDRWAVETAIKRSSLPSPARLIMYTLLTHTTNGTLTIPSEYSPSLTTLVEETGLGRGTVADHLNRLEVEGWVKRFRPTTKKALAARARTSYRITIPEAFLTRPGAEPVREPDQSESRTGSEKEQVSTSPGAGPVREPDGTRPGAGPNPTYKSSSSKKTSRKGGVGGGTSRRKPKTPAPEIFPVTDEMVSWAAKHPRGITVDLHIETERFLNWARQHDKRYSDWNAAWRNWILKAQDFADRDRARAATGTDGIRGHGPRARVNDHDWTQGGPRV